MGEIRITSGTLRGRKIQSPPGETTRPLLTRVRKSLCDILRPRLAGSRVLDLFGGSGAIALELLSNGAASGLVVELDAAAAALIRQNAAALHARLEVLAGDALKVIPRLAAAGTRFDLIVVAPPYGLGLQQKALDALAATQLLAPEGTLVVQRDSREPASAAGPFQHEQTRRYGRTVLEFYRAA